MRKASLLLLAAGLTCLAGTCLVTLSTTGKHGGTRCMTMPTMSAMMPIMQACDTAGVWRRPTLTGKWLQVFWPDDNQVSS